MTSSECFVTPGVTGIELVGPSSDCFPPKILQNINRGVARYFFFRSILMKRHFDTFASEVWAKYTSEEKFAKKCIKLKV